MQNVNTEDLAAIAASLAQTAQALAAMIETDTVATVETTAKTAKPRKAAKPKPNARVANAAVKAAAAAGFECKAYKRGTWTWLYDVNAKTFDYQSVCHCSKTSRKLIIEIEV